MNILVEIEQAIDRFHREALKDLLTQLLAALRKHYSFEEILQGLTDYTRQRGDWDKASLHIQAARLSVLEASARFRNEDEDETDGTEADWQQSPNDEPKISK